MNSGLACGELQQRMCILPHLSLVSILPVVKQLVSSFIASQVLAFAAQSSLAEALPWQLSVQHFIQLRSLTAYTLICTIICVHQDVI